MIAVIDYGMGNLRSVQKGLEKCGFEAKITGDPGEVRRSKGVIIPGVGAFKDAMSNLCAMGMDIVISEMVDKQVPVLGICLGYQLLFSASEEWGYTEGLNIISGKVRRLPGSVKVPHMGWNEVELAGHSGLMAGISNSSAFYFVHSYYVEPEEKDIIIAKTEYGINFASGINKENVYGIQFHPEKSSALGLRILQNFGGLVAKC